jgi:VWFA-related protein
VVQVDVSVMRGATPVPGLTAANFMLTDNGVPQDVTSVTLDRLPLNVMLVLDVSSSVAGEQLTHLIDAGQTLVRRLRPADRAALVTFSQQVRLEVPLTTDVAAIARALASLEGRGATSLNDAVHVALQLRPLDATRSVVIVFSDGEDNLSWLPADALVDEARRKGVVVHAIELQGGTTVPSRPPLAAQRARRSPGGTPVLRRVTAAAGGRVWSATSSRDLRILFTRALEEMRARYLLTFTPKGPPQEGWHELKVSLKDARGEVTARPGYAVSPKGH